MHINKMLDRIVQLMDENVNRERLVKDSQIRALQNQINAHFIYNVLESIKMTAEIEGEYGISDAVTALGKMLRYNMKWSGATVQLSEELDYVRHYLLLMNLRLDYTIELKTDVPKEFEIIEVPKMSLQPIVENAVLHGIEEIAEDAVVSIRAVREGLNCMLIIHDTGCGMDSTQLLKLQEKLKNTQSPGEGDGRGIGLKNVQERLHIAFGEMYGLEVASDPGKGTTVTMCIPVYQGKETIN